MTLNPAAKPCAGSLYTLNLVLGFQIGIVLSHGYKRRALMSGPLVARFYTSRFIFYLDVMAVLPFIMQVRWTIAFYHACKVDWCLVLCR